METATVLPFEEFDRAYQKGVTKVLEYWSPDMQKEIARHCIDWSPERFNFEIYLRKSAKRYYIVYKAIVRHGEDSSVCDVGGFWGAFPMCLRSLGFRNVSMTESMQYYSQAFGSLFACIRDAGVNIYDWDPFAPSQNSLDVFDVVTAMAILEHYPHSPRIFMQNVLSLVAEQGLLYIEVPNIAYWKKRFDLLLGKTPLTDIESIFLSETPFVGHHHEYTLNELRTLAKLCNLVVKEEHYIDYSQNKNTLLYVLMHPFETLFAQILRLTAKDSRECIAVELIKADGRPSQTASLINDA